MNEDGDEAHMNKDGDEESLSPTSVVAGIDGDEANKNEDFPLPSDEMNEDGDVESASFSAASEAAGGGSFPNAGVCCFRSKQSAMTYLLYYAIITLIFYRMYKIPFLLSCDWEEGRGQ